MRCLRTACVAVLGFSAASIYAAEAAFYRELILIGGYSEDLQWMSKKKPGLKNAVGFEYYRTLAEASGDYATLDIQARAVYDSSDAWGIEVHNAWLDVKTGLGRYVRLGHFDPAYGLEPLVDTHGKLFQTLAGRDIGFKKDWGLGYRTAIASVDAQTAIQLGSGMGIERRDGNMLWTGRIGVPEDRMLTYGLSALYGRILPAQGGMRTFPSPDYAYKTVLKKRLGVDARYLHGPWAWMGEITGGRNDDDDVFGGLLQLDYTVPDMQKLMVQIQGRHWTDDPGNRQHEITSASVGFSYALNADMDLRAALVRDLSHPVEEDTAVFVQWYYFGR